MSGPTDADRERTADVVTELYGMDLINFDAQTDALEPIACALADARQAGREEQMKACEQARQIRYTEFT